MFKRNEGETSATDATSETSTFHGPLMLEGPKANSQSADTPIIDLEPLRATADDKASADAEPSETAAETAAPESEHEPRRHWPSFVPLAATVAFAVAFGAIAGAAATSAFLRNPSPAPAIVAATDANRVLQDKVTQLGGELAALKSSLASSQRSASTQIGKLTERIDRTEKAQAEPAAKIAKLQDSIERLEHRPQAAAANPAADVTGSVSPKEQSKPQVAEGWRLRDFYDGRAIVESRNGTLFRVGPGSSVPGLGKVESIKRENGKVVVSTAGGTIAATLEPRRPSYYQRW
jgi:hypothetical protein